MALMTSGVTSRSCAGPDLTLSAMHKPFIRQAATASNILYRKVFTIRKNPFAGNFSPVKTHQPLLEFVIMITVCDKNGTDPAIKTTRGNQIRIYFHDSNPS